MKRRCCTCHGERSKEYVESAGKSGKSVRAWQEESAKSFATSEGNQIARSFLGEGEEIRDFDGKEDGGNANSLNRVGDRAVRREALGEIQCFEQQSPPFAPGSGGE